MVKMAEGVGQVIAQAVINLNGDDGLGDFDQMAAQDAQARADFKNSGLGVQREGVHNFFCGVFITEKMLAQPFLRSDGIRSENFSLTAHFSFNSLFGCLKDAVSFG